MSRPTVIDVRPALDVEDASERVRDAYAAVVRADKAESAASKEAETRRAEAARARLECGRELIAIRKQWPARGPKAKGWGDFLKKAGIEERTARRLMELAGYVEEVSDQPDRGSETSIPSRREIAEAKREQPRGELAVVEFPMGDDEARSPTSTTTTPAWLADLTALIEGMQRDVKSAFAKAERIQQLCDENEGATVGDMSLLTAKSMLAGVRAVAGDVLTKMGGINGHR